jgi:hypothetical protein
VASEAFLEKKIQFPLIFQFPFDNKYLWVQAFPPFPYSKLPLPLHPLAEPKQNIHYKTISATKQYKNNVRPKLLLFLYLKLLL